MLYSSLIFLHNLTNKTKNSGNMREQRRTPAFKFFVYIAHCSRVHCRYWCQHQYANHESFDRKRVSLPQGGCGQRLRICETYLISIVSQVHVKSFYI